MGLHDWAAIYELGLSAGFAAAAMISSDQESLPLALAMVFQEACTSPVVEQATKRASAYAYAICSLIPFAMFTSLN